jgi:hypothetical protein
VGTGCARLFLSPGVKPQHLLAYDVKGLVHPDRSMRGTIMVYRISTHQVFPLAQLEIAREVRIHGNNVVWVEGPMTSCSVWWHELGWLDTPEVEEPRRAAGP